VSPATPDHAKSAELPFIYINAAELLLTAVLCWRAPQVEAAGGSAIPAFMNGMMRMQISPEEVKQLDAQWEDLALRSEMPVTMDDIQEVPLNPPFGLPVCLTGS
jgi:hypothetical protein